MKVKEIHVPDAARKACALAAFDYADAFELCVSNAKAHTAEAWAHEIFANAPWAARTMIGQSWNVLGLKTRSETHWQSLQSGVVIRNDDVMVTVVHSDVVGISLCVVINVHASQVIMSSFFQRESKRISSVAWSMMAPSHRRFAPYLLASAARRMRE